MPGTKGNWLNESTCHSAPLPDARERICLAWHRGGFKQKRHRPLRVRHEKEGKIVAVVEKTKAGTDDGMFVRGVRDTHSRLKRRCTWC